MEFRALPRQALDRAGLLERGLQLIIQCHPLAEQQRLQQPGVLRPERPLDGMKGELDASNLRRRQIPRHSRAVDGG